MEIAPPPEGEAGEGKKKEQKKRTQKL